MDVEYIFQFFSSKFLQAFNVIWNTKKENNKKNGPVHLKNETPFYLQNPVHFQLEPGF